MALIYCPHCGKRISDQATLCVHCGTSFSEGELSDIDASADENLVKEPIPEVEKTDDKYISFSEFENTNKGKWILLFLVPAIVLGGLIYYFYYFYETPKYTESEPEVTETPVVKEDNEEALYTQQCESLYKTFTTKDLSFADVHGFVKSIEFRLDGLIIKIGFDTEGNIVKFQLYDWDKSDFVAAKITRSSDGAIVAIDNTSEKNIGGSREIHGDKYSFEYDKSGHVNQITCEDFYGMEFDSVTYLYTNYEENKGYMTIQYSTCVNYVEYGTKGSFSIVDLDDIGNWIKKSGRTHTSLVYDANDDPDEVEPDKDETFELDRRIVYYDKSEIDFTKFIVK